MFVPGGEGGCKTRGNCLRPSCGSRVRCTKASIGRCFLSGGEGISDRQSRGR